MGAGPGYGRGPGGRMMTEVPGVCLTAAQERQIAAIRQETQQRVMSIRTDPNLTPEEKECRIAEAQREGHDKVLAVLTPEQTRQFEDWWSARVRAGMGASGGSGETYQ